MASASGVNFVRYPFYRGNTINRLRKEALIALAYATAREQQLAPKEILIRSDIHDTTTTQGRTAKDPHGWHGTFAFKDSSQVQQEIHITTHGYTLGKDSFTLAMAMHTPEKADSTLRKNGREVWPDEADLEVYEHSNVGYSHLP